MTAPTQTIDPFSAPQDKTFAPAGPSLRCIGERLVIIVPKQIIRQEVNPFFKPAEPKKYGNMPLRDRLICDLIFVSGTPFMYGGNPTDADFAKRQDSQGPFPVPGVCHSYETDRQSIIDSINPTDVGGGVVIGYLHMVKTKNNNSAWTFGKAPAPGSPERNAAIAAYNAYVAGQLPTHSPTAPVASPTQPGYVAPTGQYIPQASPNVPIQQGNPWPNQGVTQGMGGAMTPIPQAGLATPAPVAVPPADWTLQQAPQAGMTTEQWAALAMPQRVQMLHMFGIVQPTGY